MNYLLSVDGGGTRTTVALGSEDATLLIRREGPPGIIDSRRPSASVELVEQSLRWLLSEAGIEPPVAALCAGLAGAGDPEVRDEVQRLLSAAGLARLVVVCSDAEIAFEGALAGGAGILLAGGTGSVAWGRAEDGRVARCGGWGAVAGDEGSAYWLGREAVRAVMHAYDGRGPVTTLSEAVLAAVGAATVEALPGWALRAAKRDVAALAQQVVAAAGAGDSVAEKLVEDACELLVAHAVALEGRLGPWRDDVPVVLHGGLATTPIVASRIAAGVRRVGGMKISAPVTDAVTGALRIAASRVA